MPVLIIEGEEKKVAWYVSPFADPPTLKFMELLTEHCEKILPQLYASSSLKFDLQP